MESITNNNQTPSVDNTSTTTTSSLSETSPPQQENVEFSGTETQYSVDFDSSPDPSYQDFETDDAPLAGFLSRPVSIYTGTWTTYTNFLTKIDPWILWQSDSRVVHKLSNFQYANFDMRIRVVLNGTPFHYGKLMVVYIPYGMTNTVAKDAYDLLGYASSGAREAGLQYFSTYPHGFIDPSMSNTLEMDLPFTWHNNAISLNGTAANAKESLGQLFLVDLNQLRIATPSASAALNLQIFAWTTKFHMSTPTEFVPTSKMSTKDEFPSGPVSTVASSVAKAAGMLSRVPIIGPFARASQIGAGAVGDIAKLFGFSSPPGVDYPEPAQLQLASSLALTTGLSSASCLSLDPKQEVNIDPRSVGLGAHDDMAFANIVGREQWIAKSLWKSATGPFTNDPNVAPVLFTSVVNPTQSRVTAVLSGKTTVAKTNTPGGQISQMFKYWRGSITYRVEVVCSKMHSGRIKLQFDPYVKNSANVVADTNTTDLNARYTTILDLSERHEVEFTIDYVSRHAYLATRPDLVATFAPSTATSVSNTIATVFRPESDVGIFVVSVVNELVAPNPTLSAASPTSASVDVNVYFKCSSETEFFQPADYFWPSAVFEPTSGMKPIVKTSESSEGASAFFGENVVSLRSLLKRKSLIFVGKNDPTAVKSGVQELITTLFPMYPMWRPKNSNIRNTHESFMAPSFLAKRGSTRWIVKPLASDSTPLGYAPTHLSVERGGSLTPLASYIATPALIDSLNNGQLITYFNYGVNGMALSDLSYRPLLDYQMPYYSNTRFNLAVDYKNVGTTSSKVLNVNAAMTEVLYSKVRYNYKDAQRMILEVYCGMGDDYSLFQYLAPPVQYA